MYGNWSSRASLAVSSFSEKIRSYIYVRQFILEKLLHLVSRFEEIGTLITDPAVISDMERYVKLNKEYSELGKIVAVRNQYKNALDGISEARHILDNESDADLRQLANEELSLNTGLLPQLEEQIKILLIRQTRRMRRMW